MNARVFGSLREAIHATATSAKQPMKVLAAELDWSPSELSHRTTLGGDAIRPFPADDEHLIKLMRVTGDYSPLATIADLCGFEIAPKKDRWPELVTELKQEAQRLSDRIQLVLDLKVDGQGRKR